MNRSPDPPSARRPEPAYAVPWTVDRRDRTHPVITNGAGEVRFVRVFARAPSGPGRTQLWGHVRGGDQLEVCLCDADVDDIVITLAWFRPDDGLEYVWRFVV
ncbi:hypothetical protein ACIPY5_17975 [Microbacterium sp. NPDC089698]|jgi:hypothetical protein|uniref:hypothetical protein n=1 Tax=unclassified Microbacterium TaxID=2609290 RepID=UPI00282421EF|nr:hypothetical protein [Microbacterium sp.]MDR2320389.1 hypothetical protein [Microbacterium sp.]